MRGARRPLGRERFDTLESDLIVLTWEVNGFRQQSDLV